MLIYLIYCNCFSVFNPTDLFKSRLNENCDLVLEILTYLDNRNLCQVSGGATGNISYCLACLVISFSLKIQFTGKTDRSKIRLKLFCFACRFTSWADQTVVNQKRPLLTCLMSVTGSFLWLISPLTPRVKTGWNRVAWF